MFLTTLLALSMNADAARTLEIATVDSATKKVRSVASPFDSEGLSRPRDGASASVEFAGAGGGVGDVATADWCAEGVPDCDDLGGIEEDGFASWVRADAEAADDGSCFLRDGVATMEAGWSQVEGRDFVRAVYSGNHALVGEAEVDGCPSDGGDMTGYFGVRTTVSSRLTDFGSEWPDTIGGGIGGTGEGEAPSEETTPAITLGEDTTIEVCLLLQGRQVGAGGGEWSATASLGVMILPVDDLGVWTSETLSHTLDADDGAEADSLCESVELTAGSYEVVVLLEDYASSSVEANNVDGDYDRGTTNLSVRTGARVELSY